MFNIEALDLEQINAITSQSETFIDPEWLKVHWLVCQNCSL
jgi:hypothetical protein